jgi:acetoacetyl-CoA synthetase
MGELLWQPSPERVEGSSMFRFMQHVNERFSKDFSGYPELYAWSVEQLGDFWSTLWDFIGVQASHEADFILDDPGKMPGAAWFGGARLNFAENLLRFRDHRTAIIFKGEGQPVRYVSYAELYSEVTRLAKALKNLGIQPGDRVVGFMPNMPETIMAMLAATSLGATWSSCSPDFGIKGVLDRFGQIRPRVLFTADGYIFKGKRIDSLERIRSVTAEIDSLERVVVVPYAQQVPDISGLPGAIRYPDFLEPADLEEGPEFVQLPFEHPLYIMYSSGTTGLPKCMVQSAGGILLQHIKELMLHTDVSREDTIFYFTTCGWMMWNWLTSSLALGATLVLFDGNPFQPDPGALWELAQNESISVFGTSAGYISALQNAGVKPGREYDLTALRSLLSTGSPLTSEGFRFVYQEVKEDLQLSSISGGTDLNGCFALGNPMGPVYAGELQCRGLGMKVLAYDDAGRPVFNQQGELVCTAPFPSMPICFWDDPDGSKYHQAYFDVFPGVWRHGDFIEINDRGGVIIYGRSDATLNPGGVRIGTAEIYRQVDQIEEIEDSLVIGQSWANDVRVILFVKLKPGFELTEAIEQAIRQSIRDNASPRHVPARILAVPDIPYTLNMKKVELAVKKILHGKPVLNKDALKNPESLEYFQELKEELERA